jgi:hypothetical protein
MSKNYNEIFVKNARVYLVTCALYAYYSRAIDGGFMVFGWALLGGQVLVNAQWIDQK